MTNQKRGGSAASFLGLLQYAIGGVASALVGVKGEADATPYMIILAVASVLLIVLHVINYRVFKK
jgi:MFS transporter, DHA1 family, multidrug resistance protein